MCVSLRLNYSPTNQGKGAIFVAPFNPVAAAAFKVKDSYKACSSPRHAPGLDSGEKLATCADTLFNRLIACWAYAHRYPS